MANKYGRIEVGTRVLVLFVPIVSGENAFFTAELIGRPQDVGDTFRFLLDDGRIQEINPCASSFEGICEQAEPQEEKDDG